MQSGRQFHHERLPLALTESLPHNAMYLISRKFLSTLGSTKRCVQPTTAGPAPDAMLANLDGDVSYVEALDDLSHGGCDFCRIAAWGTIHMDAQDRDPGGQAPEVHVIHPADSLHLRNGHTSQQRLSATCLQEAAHHAESRSHRVAHVNQFPASTSTLPISAAISAGSSPLGTRCMRMLTMSVIRACDAPVRELM